MPTDEHGAPVVSFYTETGTYRATYEENLRYIEREQLIDQGGDVDLSDLDGSEFGFLY